MLTVGLWQRAISLSNSEPVVVGFTVLCCERDEIARVSFEPYIELIILKAFMIDNCGPKLLICTHCTFRYCHNLCSAGHHPLIGHTCVKSQSKIPEVGSGNLLDQQSEKPNLEILIPQHLLSPLPALNGQLRPLYLPFWLGVKISHTLHILIPFQA